MLEIEMLCYNKVNIRGVVFMENKKEKISKKEKIIKKSKCSSSKKQEIKEKKVDSQKKRVKIIISICLGIVIIIVGLIILFSAPNKPSDTHYLASKIINNYNNIFNLKNGEKILIKDEGIDREYDYSHIESAIIYISTEENANTEDIHSELSIAKYNSSYEAEEKVKFLKNIYIKSHEKLDNTFIVEFDTYKELFKDEDSYIFSIDNYVININDKYKDNYEKIEKYLSEQIEFLVKKENSNSINRNEVVEYWNKKLKNLEDNYDKQYKENVAIAKKMIENQIQKMDSCYTNLCNNYYDEIIKFDKYEDFKEEMKKFKEKFNQIMINVPSFEVISYNDATNWCNENMSGCKINQEYSNSVSNGSFISQSIEEGKIVKRTDELKLVYSKGPEPSLEYKNALKKAHSYLKVMAFSYSSLVEQLEFEGYSHEASVWAVDNCGADWNEQAAKKAKNYLDVMAFSRQGLIEQLEFEGFTYDQAVYGVTQVGY